MAGEDGPAYTTLGEFRRSWGTSGLCPPADRSGSRARLEELRGGTTGSYVGSGRVGSRWAVPSPRMPLAAAIAYVTTELIGPGFVDAARWVIMLTQENRAEVERYFQKYLPARGTAKLLTFASQKERLTCAYCDEVKQLAEELAGLSHGRVTSEHHWIEDSSELAKRLKVHRTPATVVTDGGSGLALKFYGLPGGYEFTALLEDIVDVMRGEPRLSSETVAKLRALTVPTQIQVFVTPTCPYCPKAVRMAHQFSQSNPQVIDAEMVESMEFPALADQYSVMAVPKVVVNDRVQFEGALPEQDFLEQVIGAARTS